MTIRQTTPQEAYALIGRGYRYIDVRTEQEFSLGHPTTAVNVPVALADPRTRQMVINPDFLSIVEAHFSKDSKIIVGCQAGGRSQRAAELLAQAGYTDVVNMQGGFGGGRDQSGTTVISGWSECGLPTCKDCGTANSYAGLLATAR